MAAAATFLSMRSELPLWAMFIGWVAFFTRPSVPKEVVRSLVCIVLGLVFGAVAAQAMGRLAPILGPSALIAVVFLIVLVVVSLRGVPFANNVLGYFMMYSFSKDIPSSENLLLYI